MSFKQNLLKKIAIDKLADTVLRSIDPADGTKRIDRAAMKRLLVMSPGRYRKERDLDLYILPATDVTILVFDNELPIYRTSIADVAMRKSPTIKEMISIRNAMKILSDTDVVVSKKADTVETIRDLCLEQLDLDYSAGDIDELRLEGIAALESGDERGVEEILVLFTELLGYRPPPKAMALKGFQIAGQSVKSAAGGVEFGPLFIYDADHNRLQLIQEALDSQDPEQRKFLKQVAEGRRKGDADGPDVFRFLAEAVIRRRG